MKNIYNDERKSVHAEEEMFKMKQEKNILRLTPKGQKDGKGECILVDIFNIILVEPISTGGSKITLDIFGEKREYEVDETTSIIGDAIKLTMSKKSS